MSHLRSRFPHLYRFAATLALLAMFVPMLTMLVHQPAVAQSMMHICGGNFGGGQNQKSPTHKLPNCPVCQSLHLLGGGFVPPAKIAIVFVAPVAAPLSVAFFDFHPSFTAAPQAQPRAPPAFA